MTSTPHIIIRPFQDDDAQAMAELHRRAILHSYPAVYSAQVVEDWANSRRPEKYFMARERGEEFLVAECKGQPVGFISWNQAELSAMYVDPEFQGLSIGTQMVIAADTAANEKGSPIQHVTAALSARGFYEKMGFKVVRNSTSTVSGHEIPDFYMER